MAFIQCDFHSDALRMATTVNVILPQKTTTQIGLDGKTREKPPVLYLLHGSSDDHTIWMRRTAIERYVAPLGLAVIMPNVHRSYYTNMNVGEAYWTFLTEELPATMNSFFNLSNKQEDRFVAGLSMGGYGAMKWGLSKPNYFSHVASLSGVLDIAHSMQQIINNEDGYFNAIRRADFEAIFGSLEAVKGSNNDLFHLIEQLITSGQEIPRLFQCCGTEDFLYKDNISFKNMIAQHKNIDLTYMEGVGDHSWEFWDTYIQHVLKWLPLKNI